MQTELLQSIENNSITKYLSEIDPETLKAWLFASSFTIIVYLLVKLCLVYYKIVPLRMVL